MDETVTQNNDRRTDESDAYRKLLEDGSDLHPALREHVLRLADEALLGTALLDEEATGQAEGAPNSSIQHEEEGEHGAIGEDSVSEVDRVDEAISDIGEAAVETVFKVSEKPSTPGIAESKKEYRNGLSKEAYDKLNEASLNGVAPYFDMYIEKYKKLQQPPDISEVEKLKEWALQMAEIHASVKTTVLELIGKGVGKAELEQFPEVKEFLDKLGIEQQSQEKMFRSWLTYKPRRDLDVSKPEGAEKYAHRKARKIVNELIQLDEYEETYGLEELEVVKKTFGICNFSRYKPEILHNQLVNWQNGNLPTGNVVAIAISDWNGAFSSAGTDIFEELKDTSTVFFEVENPSDIARAAVKVGNRERQNGRSPETGNYVKNFIIAGHGSPDAIAIGDSIKDELTVGKYTIAENRRRRLNATINTFRRHLGNNFQVILDSCSTAGSNGKEKDIAESISDSHDVLVKADTVAAKMVEITEDGEVVFRLNKGKINVAATIDGRKGDGIKVTMPFKTRMRKWKDQIKRSL